MEVKVLTHSGHIYNGGEYMPVAVAVKTALRTRKTTFHGDAHDLDPEGVKLY